MKSNVVDTSSYYNNPNWNIMNYYGGRVEIDLLSCIIENIPSDKIGILKHLLELLGEIVITSVVPLTKNVALIFFKDSKSAIKLLKRKKIKIGNETNVNSYCLPNSKYCTLFIGNIDKTLSPQIVEENIKSLFNNYSEIRVPIEVYNSGAELINRTINKGDDNWYEEDEKERAKIKNKGYAFIEFSTHFYARQNYEAFIRNPLLLNRIVTIDWSKSTHNNDMITNPLYISNENKLSSTELYFQGVTEEMKSTDLYKSFSKFGLVRNLKLSRDHSERKDYGFVNFENPQSAANCMKNFKNLNNNLYLRFEYAKVREIVRNDGNNGKKSKEKENNFELDKSKSRSKSIEIETLNKNRHETHSKNGNICNNIGNIEDYKNQNISDSYSDSNTQSFINTINTELSLKEDDRLFKALNREYNPLETNNTNSSLYHLNNLIASNANKANRDSGILFYKKQEKITNINEKKNYVNKFDECYMSSVNKIDSISIPNTINDKDNQENTVQKLKSDYALNINDVNTKLLNNISDDESVPIVNIPTEKKDNDINLGIENSFGIGNFNVKREINQVKTEFLNDIYKIKTDKTTNDFTIDNNKNITKENETNNLIGNKHKKLNDNYDEKLDINISASKEKLCDNINISNDYDINRKSKSKTLNLSDSE